MILKDLEYSRKNLLKFVGSNQIQSVIIWARRNLCALLADDDLDLCENVAALCPNFQPVTHFGFNKNKVNEIYIHLICLKRVWYSSILFGQNI